MDSNKHNAELDFLVHLRQNYVSELPEKIELLEALMLSVEKDGDEQGEIFRELFRSVHSLKGSGGTYGYFIITKVCHKLEDYLRLVGGGNTQATPTLKSSDVADGLKFIDLLKEIATASQNGNTLFNEVEAKLAALVKELDKHSHELKGIIVVNSRVVSAFCHKAMSQFGIHTVVLDNSYQALLQLLTTQFDILVTGAEMPLLTGSALVAAVRLSDTVNKSIPTILITSKDNIMGNTKRATDPDYIVHKDVELVNHLEAALSDVLKRRYRVAGTVE